MPKSALPGSAPKDVFIFYARKASRKYAEALHTALGEAGDVTSSP